MKPSDPQFWVRWLCQQALPLWRDTGFDPQSNSFIEQLGLDGSAQRDVPRRVMVQARQIHVYATAGHNGWDANGTELAVRAGEAMISYYAQSDGSDGWAFSCSQAGAVVDQRRDLYAHAFVLLALADLIQATSQRRYIELAQRTLAFLDREMAHPAGGFVEQWPNAQLPRRQNPHMHLLEAFLALQATGLCGDLTPQIASIVFLFSNHFFSEDGILSEYFDSQWAPQNIGKVFEPGHHFEWAWLLNQFSTATRANMEPQINRLLKGGRRGVDSKGRIVDQMNPKAPQIASCRLWGAMEATRALTLAHEHSGSQIGSTEVLQVAWETFIAPAYPGGWIDQVDTLGHKIVNHIPASSLYHIVTAIDVIRRLKQPNE
jgi:mannose/cellobiose epimerase-like protein (N-acyl-D-glucosamine 2-epimerase family)